ncbi:hypothetical protein OUZ56_012254 [Daphnia magna]|uniref:Uncharacterized protein n=1 Tax=Daphnia magna TaxID=35525 RepID=A0ABQ9Z2G4_9CRUS|nr:hypothetical protein OUZ56_012254 [Daphnia magna]
MADEQKEQTTIAKRRKSPGNQAVARTLPGTVEGQYNSLVFIFSFDTNRDNNEQQEEMLREDISERHMFEILRLPMCEILIKGETPGGNGEKVQGGADGYILGKWIA